MLREERLDEMGSYIKQVKTASMQELCSQFNVSQNTLRRDLNELLKTGMFKKIYGGITLKSINSQLIDYSERQHWTSAHKALIGKKAAEFIKEDDLVFIDSGTTTAEMAAQLPKEIQFTLVTNSLQIILAATQLKNIKLIIIGSNFNRNTQSFVGIQTNSFFNSLNFDKAFMSATALSINNGVCNSEVNEYEIKKNIISRQEKSLTQKNILMVDYTKFDQTALLTYADLKQFNIVITSGKIEKKYNEFFSKNKIRLINEDI